MSRAGHQHGFILMPVVIAIVLIATIAFMLNNQSTINVDETGDMLEAEQVENITHAALTHATWGAQNSGCAGDMGMTAVPFGQASTGSYTATVTTPGGATTAYPNLAVDQDAWFNSDNPTSNSGTTADMHLRMESGSLEYALYRFDLSSLPAGSQINSASAWLYVATGGPGGGAFPEGPLTVHRVTADWTETGATWDTMNTNYDSAVIATIPAQPVDGVWVQVNLTAQVQAWVNGGEANYGIMLMPTAEGTHGKLASREAAASQQPRLDVIVGTGPATPMTITATGTLPGNPSPANDITRTLTRTNVPANQPGSYTRLQPGAVSGKDTEIWDQAPNNNYGNAAETWVSSASNDTTRTLLHFNMDAIPAGARILGAALSLNRQSGSGADQPVSAHRIKNPWNEDAVTWKRRETGTNWDTAGGDFDNIAVATTPVGPVNQRYEWSITPLVQGWVDGSYPNYGVALIAAIAGMPGERFNTSDHADPSLWPSLSITYACECGSPCLAPQGSGSILMVVSNSLWMTPDEIQKIALFESWGYTVIPISQWDVDWNFDTLAASSDVVYVSEGVDHTTWGMAPKLAATSLAVINEEGQINDELGIASGFALPVGPAINVTDTSHYITALFSTGPLDIYSAGMEQLTVSGTDATGLQTLADTGGFGSLVVLDKGAALAGGGTAAGRRVMLPLGTEAKFNWDYLNGNGRLIVQRALQWGTGHTAVTPAGNLLLVVVNPGSLTAQEDAKKTLIESWGYAVNLIDEADIQANYDTALAANDVVYITEDVNASTVGTKMVNATIGVVTEEDNLSDEFGLSDSIHWGSGTVLKVDAAHYITETFTPGILTILTATESLADLTGSLAPGLQIHGVSTDGPSLVSVEAGADVIAGRTAVGRRVQLPWGGNNFDVNHLNTDGMTIMQRSIEWGAGAGGSSSMLIGHWMLDDGSGLTAIDSSGNGNDGTLTDSTGPVWTIGTLAGALDFDGSNDRVLVPNDPSLDITETITLAAWIKPNVTGTEYVIRKAQYDSTDGYELSLSTAGKVFFRLNQASNANTYRIDSTTSYPTDGTTWMHIAASYDGAVMRLYLDGVEEATLNAAITIATNNTDLSIGAQVDGSRGINGVIDDARLYGKALSVAEIADLAVPPPILPIAHWKLDDASGLTAVDSVGGHDGTLTSGGPVWTAGQVDGALHFDGSNDYINVPHDPTLNLASALTISTWFRADSFGAGIGGYRTFVSKYPNATTANYWFGTWKQELVFGFWSGGVWQEVFPTGLGLSTGQWYQAAVTFDDVSNQVLLYLDGTLVHTGVMTLTPPVNTGAVTIGRSAAGEYWDGQLDDVRIYDSVLPASEITALFAAGNGGGGGGGEPPPPTGCDGTFRDEFNAQSFDGSDGTLPWAGSWQEIGESDGPKKKDIGVYSDQSNYQLRIQDNDNNGEGVARAADLTGAASAVLSFQYRRDGLDKPSDYVTVSVSASGTSGPWTELTRFAGSATDSNYIDETLDLTLYISATTAIRLLSSPDLGGSDRVWFDNIQITCTP